MKSSGFENLLIDPKGEVGNMTGNIECRERVGALASPLPPTSRLIAAPQNVDHRSTPFAPSE